MVDAARRDILLHNLMAAIASTMGRRSHWSARQDTEERGGRWT